MTSAETYRDLDEFTHSGTPTFPYGWLSSLMSGNDPAIPAWWSPARDIRLRQYWKESGHLASAVNTVTTKILGVPWEIRAKNKNNQASVRRAEEYTRNLRMYSQEMQGVRAALSLFLQDYLTQDNGGFMLALAPPSADGSYDAIDSPVMGIKHLDAQRCTRTGDFEYPVIYRPAKGKHQNKPIPLHMSRVMSMVSQPSSDETRNGVGYSAVSRAFDAAQAILDMVRFKREKLGSMPARQILFGNGMSNQNLQNNFLKGLQMIARSGNSMFAKTMAFAEDNPDAMLHLIDLASSPDGFDEKISMTLSVYAMAWAFDVDSRTFWTATESGATKADAQVQHLKSMGQGISLALRGIEDLFGRYVLPPDIEMVFDYIDDEQDRITAESRNLRATQRTADINNGTYDIRTARLRALDAGDLQPPEFDALELADGRLPNGLPVLSLFESDEYSALLNLGVPDPTNPTENDAAVVLAAIHLRKRDCMALALTATREKPHQQAERALAALIALEKLYTQPAPPTNPVPTEEENPIPPDEEVEKSLGDYRRSLRALARGYYNGDFERFTFVDDMVGAISRNLTQAWNNAAQECGLSPDEITEEESAVLKQKINGQFQYILGLADAIEAAKENEEAVTTLFDRIELWVNRYDEVFQLGRTLFCGDKKMKWRRDPAKDSCPDCVKFDGRVYRASVWAKNNVYPKSPDLACGGFRCGCNLEETDDPITKGRVPKLTGKKKNLVIEGVPHGKSECGCGHPHN